jgi:hypothetical protein
VQQAPWRRDFDHELIRVSQKPCSCIWRQAALSTGLSLLGGSPSGSVGRGSLAVSFQ